MRPKIFISYRRADSSAYVGRIYDRLVQAFGKNHIFKDVDNIPIGVDFRQVLTREVNKCNVVFVIMGRQWLDIRDEYGRRRIDNPDDFVRIEVASALARPDCLVVPVLLQNTMMPPPNYLPPDLQLLPYKNAAVVRDDPDFHHDLSRLIHNFPQKAPFRLFNFYLFLATFISLAVLDYTSFSASRDDGTRQRFADLDFSAMMGQFVALGLASLIANFVIMIAFYLLRRFIVWSK